MDLVTSVVTAGTAKTAASALLTAKEKLNQMEMLKEDLASAQEFLGYLKEQIKVALGYKINLCTLPTLVDAVNAFQLFYKKNFTGWTNKAFSVPYPEYYRLELQLAFNHMQIAFDKYTLEISTYVNAVGEEFLESGEKIPDRIISKIQAQVKSKSSECAKIVESFRKTANAEGGWDECKECSVRNQDYQTPSEKYVAHKYELRSRTKNTGEDVGKKKPSRHRREST